EFRLDFEQIGKMVNDGVGREQVAPGLIQERFDSSLRISRQSRQREIDDAPGLRETVANLFEQFHRYGMQRINLAELSVVERAASIHRGWCCAHSPRNCRNRRSSLKLCAEGFDRRYSDSSSMTRRSPFGYRPAIFFQITRRSSLLLEPSVISSSFSTMDSKDCA